jgi:uncharacterized protein YndB with AHSA1/START domain
MSTTPTSQRSITHAAFTVERVFPVAPARVFHAFADKDAKAAWFGGPDEWTVTERAFDFRVGGHEVDGGGPVGGPVSRMDLTYYDIVPDQRIVYTYEMTLDGTRISVSLATIELTPDGGGTRFVLTEHGAYLDGHDSVDSREHGTIELVEALGRSLLAD